MEWTAVYAVVGFLLAAYSVVSNDSIQTLGPFIESTLDIKWQYLWLGASLVLIATLGYGWLMYGGDISYGRLNRIPYQEVKWYHPVAVGTLVLLTWRGIPVSTTFLVLSTFATSVVLKDMLLKSAAGYVIAAVLAYALWYFIADWDKESKVKESHKKWWRILLWISTGFLWFTWLSHDMANIAVFLPRAIPFWMLLAVMGVLILGLAYIFWKRGSGKIQDIVIEKHNTKYVRSSTLINLVFAFILLFFKEFNDVPMSTTWVFVGLLAGRELAVASVLHMEKFKIVFPLIRRDFFKMMIGLGVSVALVLAIQVIHQFN